MACDGHVAAVQAQVAAHHAAVLHELGHDAFGHVDRNGEANPLR
jgi:hypothetical protein